MPPLLQISLSFLPLIQRKAGPFLLVVRSQQSEDLCFQIVSTYAFFLFSQDPRKDQETVALQMTKERHPQSHQTLKINIGNDHIKRLPYSPDAPFSDPDDSLNSISFCVLSGALNGGLIIVDGPNLPDAELRGNNGQNPGPCSHIED